MKENKRKTQEHKENIKERRDRFFFFPAQTREFFPLRALVPYRRKIKGKKEHKGKKEKKEKIKANNENEGK